MGLNSMDADLKIGLMMSRIHSIFDKWRSTASRTCESTTSTYYLEIVWYKSGLQNSNELSSLKTADTYSTISMVASTGNAPKSTSTQTVHHVVTDEVYTNLVQLSTKEAMDIKSNKDSPKQLTPVTIMVVDTISSMK